jgi:regulator of protease activity HflC (stomatin/prohibitin superfamily)
LFWAATTGARDPVFDKLIDLVVGVLRNVQIVHVLPEYEGGVVLRRGRFQRLAKPGLVWTLPLLDHLLTATTVPTTDSSDRRDFTLPNGRTVSIQIVATWRVVDVRKHLLGVTDARDAVLDSIVGVAGEVLETASDDAPSKLAARIKRRANARAKNWGIRFDAVQFSSFVSAPAVRLIGDTKPVTD